MCEGLTFIFFVGHTSCGGTVEGGAEEQYVPSFVID
jgi:hypothetical protein